MIKIKKHLIRNQIFIKKFLRTCPPEPEGRRTMAGKRDSYYMVFDYINNDYNGLYILFLPPIMPLELLSRVTSIP